jgi:hypothetical protein
VDAEAKPAENLPPYAFYSRARSAGYALTFAVIQEFAVPVHSDN